jgi:hypothetical protein
MSLVPLFGLPAGPQAHVVVPRVVSARNTR